MATSDHGKDLATVIGRVTDHYRTTDVHYPGARFDEPAYAAPGSTPTDWITFRILRSESSSRNVENAQWRALSIAVWLFMQPDRGDYVERVDAVFADLADAFSWTRDLTGENFDGTFSALGAAAAPPGLALTQNWIVEAFEWRGDMCT